MVDATTLVVLSAIVQTIVITVTLIVFVMQFRSQEKAIRESSYQGLMGRYNDFIRSMVEKPVLAKFLVNQRFGGEVSEDVATVYAHLLVAYGIIEEAFLLYTKKWIDEDTWLQWSAWLVVLGDSPQFKDIHENTNGTFDKRFEEYVSKILRKKNTENAVTKNELGPS